MWPQPRRLVINVATVKQLVRVRVVAPEDFSTLLLSGFLIQYAACWFEFLRIQTE